MNVDGIFRQIIAGQPLTQEQQAALDKVNAYANAMISQEKLQRSRPEHDFSTDGQPLRR